MSHMYGNEPPQGYYPEEEERYSQSELEELDFQRYRDYVISEEHNYDAPVKYVQEAHDGEHCDAAPVYYDDTLQENNQHCLDCDEAGYFGDLQPPEWSIYPYLCLPHNNERCCQDLFEKTNKLEIRLGVS